MKNEPCGKFIKSYREDLRVVRTKMQFVLLAGFLVFIFVIPTLLFTDYILSAMNFMLITLIAVHGLNIVTGLCGQVNVGQSGFVMAGGYISAILTTRLEAPFVVALPLTGLLTVLLGLLFGIPSLRVKGFYLAIVTLGSFFIIDFAVKHGGNLTNETSGMAVARMGLGGITLLTQRSNYLFILTITMIMTFLMLNLKRSRVGRNFIAIRDNDLAAEAMGVNVFRYKLLAFCISSFFAGISGCLYAHYVGNLNPEAFNLWQSIAYLGMIIVGGMGSVVGSIFGTIMLRGLDELGSYAGPVLVSIMPGFMSVDVIAPLTLFFTSVVVIVFLIFEPRGLAHRWEVVKSYYRLWPFSY